MKMVVNLYIIFKLKIWKNSNLINFFCIIISINNNYMVFQVPKKFTYLIINFNNGNNL